MLREIALDTETTGTSVNTGDKIVEIGCVEMIDHVPTGNYFHKYINPMRDMPQEAFAIHGLSNEFLSDKPVFGEVAKEFLDFIGNGILVIHNAPFDMGFINTELKNVGINPIGNERVVDTLAMARQIFPGGESKSLDALCKKFHIDNSSRTKHGALLDSQLLAEVYLELLGGKELSFTSINNKKAGGVKVSYSLNNIPKGKYREPRLFPISEEEEINHKEFLEKNVKNPIWQ